MIHWSMRQLPSGDYQGMIAFVPGQSIAVPGFAKSFPKGKPIKLKASGKTKAQALAKAASVAKMVMDNPILKDVMPPGSHTALAAVEYLSKSASAGKLASAAKKFTGAGAKRLIKGLSSLW